MKNSNNENRDILRNPFAGRDILKSARPEIKNMLIVLFLSCSALFMASCQKAEIIQPAYPADDAAALKQGDPAGAPFSFMAINHCAGSTQLPEYAVTVNADGRVIYEGKSHVAVKGKVEFEISSSSINELNELFVRSGFMRMKDAVAWSPDLAINSISYAINRGPVGVKTLHDDNRDPAELVSLRNKVEDLLGISKYVKKRNQAVSASAVTIN